MDLFIKQAQEAPDKIAIIEKDNSVSFGILHQKVEETAAYFQSKGVLKGDRVLIFVPMGLNLYRIVLALFRIGATAVFLDEWVNLKRMEQCCRVAQCKVLISVWKGKLLTFISSELRKIPVKLSVTEKTVNQPLKAVETSPEDTALITFTTGSSGVPKAAKRTHGFLQEQLSVLSRKIDPSLSDVDMPVLPIVLLINLGMGITSVIADFKSSKPDSLKPDKILHQLKKYGVKSISSSPYFILSISSYLLKNNRDFSQIKRIFTGGAPVFPSEANSYLKVFPQAYIEVLYGSTEAEPISSVEASELSRRDVAADKGLFVGELDKAAMVKIIEIRDDKININSVEELQLLELPAGSIGEIIVSGKHVLSEYFNNDMALARNKIFVESTCWHRTGDSGFVKNGNHLYLTGPCTQLIQEKEEVLSPFLYEYHFSSVKGLVKGALITFNGKKFAVLETERGFQKKNINDQIEALEFIDEVFFIKKMPRDPRHHSKIDYQKLLKMIS